MKNTIALIAMFAMLTPCMSQDLPDYSINRNEFNLGYFNAFELNGLGDLGIGYKRLTDKGAFRTGVGMSFSKSQSENQSYVDNSKWNEISPRIGFEFHQWYKRIRLQYGVDARSSFSTYSSENSYDDPENDRTSSQKSYVVGIRPVLGITVYLSKTISIATETYMDVAFSKSTEERTYYGETDTYESQGVYVGLGPLGIVSVNFHF
jgi:hypothetical protein